MPAYDFKCKTCENKFTVRVSISERNSVKCPECNSSAVQQVISPVCSTVKGGGSSFSGGGSTCGGGSFG